MMEVGRLDPGDIIDYQINKKGFTYALLASGTGDDESRFIPPMRGQFYDIVPFWATEPTVLHALRGWTESLYIRQYGHHADSARAEHGRPVRRRTETDDVVHTTLAGQIPLVQ